MLYRILAVGDVVGEPGLAHLERVLRPLKKQKEIQFTVVNGENASGVGLMPEQAWRIYDAGADVVTLGNHTFGKMQIRDMLEETPWLLRPANYASRAPGRGCGIFEGNGLRSRVINLIGRCGLDWKAETTRILRWWIFTPRPPARSWRWGIIWTGGSVRFGAPTPMCPPLMSGSIRREPVILPTSA